MLRTILFSLTLISTSVTYGACLPDTAEIGDIGPGSQLVCNMLEARYPQSNIAVLDRKIHSQNTVLVIVSVDGQSESLKYNLRGADWMLTEPSFADSY